MKLMKNWVLLILYAISTAYLFYQASYSWPYVGGIQSLFLLIVMPVLVYQLLFVFYTYISKTLPSKTFLLRFMSIIVGLVLAGNLISYSSSLPMKGFETIYQKMPNYIDLTKASPCLIDFWKTEQVVNYNQTINKFIGEEGKPLGTLWYNKARFIIEFRGGGEMGTDGSTIYFDSTTNQWVLLDNEDEQKRTLFFSTVSNLKECRF